jgi:hypothetical protein
MACLESQRSVKVAWMLYWKGKDLNGKEFWWKGTKIMRKNCHYGGNLTLLREAELGMLQRAE